MWVWVGTLEVEGKGGRGRDCEVGSAFFLCRVVGVKNVLGFWDNGRGMMVLLGLVVFICSYAVGLCCVCKGRKYIHSKLCYADATKCLSTRCKSSASRGRI